MRSNFIANRNLKFVAQLALCGMILSGCNDADGASNNNNFEHGPWVFADDRPGDITLNMVRSVGQDPNDPTKVVHSPIVLTTKIPRNLISMCEPYARGGQHSVFNVQSLPDEVFCKKVNIDLNYADGKAMTVTDMFRGDNYDHLRNQPQPSDIIFGKLPENRGGVDIKRYYEMSVDISIKFDYVEELFMRESRWRRADIDGFEVYMPGTAGATALFDNFKKDGVEHVSCSTADPLAKHSLIAYCTYYFPLNDQLQAEVKFIDFREHGGRLFLEERIAALKKWICPIFNCNEQVLAQAQVRGGF